MLVLTRKQQQQIKIGDEITITILRLRGNTVRVGIEAPRTVRVVRGELPPEGQGETGQEMTIVEGVVRVTDEEASKVDVPATAGRVLAAAGRISRDEVSREGVSREEKRESHSLSHLPQRRVLNRSGSAPLRVVMAGAVLAK